jgi:hypothetical protein
MERVPLSLSAWEDGLELGDMGACSCRGQKKECVRACVSHSPTIPCMGDEPRAQHTTCRHLHGLSRTLTGMHCTHNSR